MYKIFTLLVLLGVVGCTPGPESIVKLISDHEQTLENTKIDLSLEIQELNKTGYILNRDSLNYYNSKLDSIKRIIDNRLHKKLTDYSVTEKVIDSVKEYYSILNAKTFSKSSLDSFLVWSHRGMIMSIYQIKSGQFFDDDSIYVNKWLCTYSIKNPFLNNVKQTITKTYLIYPDESGILKTE